MDLSSLLSTQCTPFHVNVTGTDASGNSATVQSAMVLPTCPTTTCAPADDLVVTLQGGAAPLLPTGGSGASAVLVDGAPVTKGTPATLNVTWTLGAACWAVDGMSFFWGLREAGATDMTQAFVQALPSVAQPDTTTMFAVSRPVGDLEPGVVYELLVLAQPVSLGE